MKLSPFLDQDGPLRVGGRTSSSDMSFDDKHPVIIPKTHTATLLVKHYHDQVAHQGRHFTEGALRLEERNLFPLSYINVSCVMCVQKTQR